MVKIITYGDSYNQYINKDNLYIITITRNPSKFRLINLFLKFYNFWYTLKLCNSDIYYNRVPSYATFIIALFSKLYNKKFIFATANERHCNNDIFQILGKSITKYVSTNRSAYLGIVKLYTDTAFSLRVF